MRILILSGDKVNRFLFFGEGKTVKFCLFSVLLFMVGHGERFLSFFIICFAEKLLRTLFRNIAVNKRLKTAVPANPFFFCLYHLSIPVPVDK